MAKSLFFIFLIFDIAVFGGLFYLNDCLGEDFKIKKGDTLNLNSPLPVTAVYNGTELNSRHTNENVGNFQIDLKMFGIIPFSKAQVQIVDQMQVAVLGQPFGMKLYTKGVLVVDISDVSTSEGNRNPAKQAGLKIGDYISSINGKEITTNEDLVDLVQASEGKALDFKILRDNKTISLNITPVASNDNSGYKIGVWVRDSSAGIGTLTFYSPATDIICGLGHGVCDEDTGELLKLSSGEIVSAEIYSVEKGEKGSPGQLNGRLSSNTLGRIQLNCSGGVYSLISGEIPINNLTEVALKTEVQNGNAQILCTVNGSTPELYDCTVALKKGKFDAATQNMIITVTDPRLLETTGGIVQGLSGSPILQNGKLIGAVTHVLIDDPAKGYGIFAENMLENAQKAEKSLKKAS